MRGRFSGKRIWNGNATLSESKPARMDLLRAENYPDSDDTTDPLDSG